MSLNNIKIWNGSGWALPKPVVTVSGESSDVVVDIDGVSYRIVTWLSSGSLNVFNATLFGVDYLMVGGGGGGGNSYGTTVGGGGGGAGGVITNRKIFESAQPLNILPDTYTVVVGAGGDRHSNGSDSSFYLHKAIGGGSGGGADPGNTMHGGSGGGANSNYLNTSPGSGVKFQGHPGGNGSSSYSRSGGGGGGAGSPGQSVIDAPNQGYGGDGIQVDITGTPVYYGGGGGGGAFFGSSNIAYGGLGGGGDGRGDGSDSNGWFVGTAGTDGLGGGGGAGRRNIYNGVTVGQSGMPGGDGVVILRWPIENEA